MRFDRAGIESVDLRDLGPAAGAAQLGRKGLERRGIAPCQEEFRTLSREYLSNRAADVAARTVEDGGPVIKQHWPPTPLSSP